MEFVSKIVKKDFKGFGVFKGVIESFDASTGFYRIAYEDGDSEEVDLAEVNSLVHATASEEIPFQKENVKRKVGRKPKKRRRIRGDPGNGTDNLVDNSARSTGHLEGDYMVARNSNGSMSVNKNLDSIGSGNDGLDLNRVVNSDDGLVFGDASLANVCGIRGGIDLNFTADNNIDDKLAVETDCFGTETKKREHDFDLNSAINDEDLMLGGEDEGRLINVPVQNIESKMPSSLNDTQNIVVEIVCLGNDIHQAHKDSADGSLKANQNRNSFVAGITSTVGLPTADIDTVEVRIGEGQSDAVTPSTSRDAAGGHRKRRKVVEDDSLLKSVLRRSARRARASQNNKSGTAVKDEANELTSPGSNVVSDGRSQRRCFEGVQRPNVLPPMVELPPSSSNLSIDGIPASDLFSVYAFLRSFSTFLFLSPFELEDLVESVKSTVAHSLLDHIHLSILQTLRPHIQFLANEGSESASTCLRSLNWDLLDEITWPLFMVEYLLFHGSGFEPGFSVGDLKLVDCEYYKQPAKLKIQMLRCLCDDVLEVEGIRLELNKRMNVANLNVYFDRNSNYDASKRRRALTDSSRLTDDFANEAADWNSDECCLCKMDGSLICCDGCPAAYHARCVGVASSLLPEGDWYCPECMIGKGDNGTQPHRLVRGAELLGSDPYGRLYYSCCGYLLVSTICDAESSFRYYQRNDLSTVVQVLQSSGSIYDTIVSAISRHWSVGADCDQRSHNLNPTLPICRDATGLLVEPRMVDEAMDGGKHSEKMEDLLNSSDGTAEALQAGKGIQSSNNPRVDSDGDLDLKAANVPAKRRKRGRPVGSYRKKSLIEALVQPKMSEELMNGEKHSKTMENLVSSSEGSPESVQGSKGVQNFNNPRVDSDGYLGLKAASVPAKRRKRGRPVGSYHKNSPAKDKEGEIYQLQGRTCYMNCYSFARTASSVVEELTRKTSNKSNEALPKSEEEIIAAQMKIILKHSTRMCWPTSETLTVEIQKEKCGWCYSCRSPVGDKDCLFNMCNAYSVLEGLKREGSGLQPKRSKKGHLVDLICCLLSIEERLQGLLLGPWLSPNYSELWRKNLLKASDLVSVKYHLLTLESNLNHLAFSAEWWKHVDSAARMGSAFHIVIHSRQSIKHGINQRRVRCVNPSPTLNAAGGLSMYWWRGGKISRKLFNWKALPHSWALKCARKGGSIKIPDILYVDGSEYAKRSQQVVWRAAVENTTCTEQLALQMRVFDLHIKWDDIENTHLQPNLNNERKKSLRLFKKVIIRRVRVEGIMVKYLLDFGKRRSIPKVVMRHGAMLKEPSSERKKYWLEESKVPLHLLKTFEGKRIARRAGKRNSSKVLEDSKVMKKPIKRHDFQYLFSRAERPENHECGHCKKSVPIRDAVSCQYCNGFFHKRHVRRSSMSVTAACIYTCHRCQAGKHTETHRKRGGIKLRKLKNTKSVRSVGGGRKMKSKRGRKAKAIVGQASSKKGRKMRVQVQPSASQGKVQVQLSTSQGTVQVPSTPQGNTSSGVALRRSARTAKHIALQYDELAGGKKRSQRKSRSFPSKKSMQDSSWRKKRRQRASTFWKNGLLLSRKINDERVTSFQRRKLLTVSESSMGIGDQPKCPLCHEEGYTSALKYIACELCGGWFHADAFGLEAENIKCLIGFRCHICRQRKPPVCPYVGYTPSNGVRLSVVAKGCDAFESPEEPCEAVIVSKETNANSHNHSVEDSRACSGPNQAPMMDIELSVENGYMPCTDDTIIDGSQNCNGNLDARLNARSRENPGLDNIAEPAKHPGTYPEAV